MLLKKIYGELVMFQTLGKCQRYMEVLQDELIMAYENSQLYSTFEIMNFDISYTF